MRSRLGTGLSLAALLLAVCAQPAVAAGKPDLVEHRANVNDHIVKPGGHLTITDVVLNRGGASAGRSATRYTLVKFACFYAHPRCLPPIAYGQFADLGTRSVHALRSGRRSLGHHSAAIPKTMQPGTYYLFACADDGSAVSESNEDNNCRSTKHRVEVRAASGDRTAPDFAGLDSATTCIPGPIGGDRQTSYTLKWKPATDDGTPQEKIVYDVYQATAMGGEDFSQPTYTSDPGATEYRTPALSTGKSHYFVVRSRDGAGNRDSNRVEREGVNICE